MIYLDYAATTPVKPGVLEALASEFAEVGNASSAHSAGRRARRVVEEAREAVAELVGALPGEVVFTSGGTEADNLAVKGLFEAAHASEPQRRVVAISNVEHPAVSETAAALVARGAEVLELPVDRDGVVSVERALELLEPESERLALVSLMWVNNELGTVQPVAELAHAVGDWGVATHSDAVQAVGPLEIDFKASRLSALSLSAHKLGGPQGVGALVLDRGAKCTPQSHGGGQERDLRSGTLSTALIAGLGEAAKLAVAERAEVNARVEWLRFELERRVAAVVPGAMFNGSRAPRIQGTSSITLPGTDSAALLIALDALGVCCSAGSACAAGSLKPSPTLHAIGLSAAEQLATIRVSLGWRSTESDVAAFCSALEQAVLRSKALI